MHRIGFILIIVLIALSTEAQNDILNRKIPALNLENGSTIKEAITYLESTYGLTFSYSSSQFNLQDQIKIPNQKVALSSLLKSIFYKYNISLEQVNEAKIAIKASLKKIRFYGFVKDKASNETLLGPNIINLSTKEVYSTNDKGYFSLTIQEDITEIEIRYLGYYSKKMFINHDGSNIRQDIYLKFDNEIQTVEVRRNVTDNELQDPGSDIIKLDKNYGNKGVSGSNDLINYVRNEDGVATGGEGMVGLYVNGGANDENLILLQGMPLYEVSHVAGITSILQEEAIKSANFIKNGIPARYGGRMSSVLNVDLKDGHSTRPKRSISIGITDARFGFEGPLSTKYRTTFNLAGRTSLLNYSYVPFVNKYSVFDRVKLQYNDLTAKITHQIDSLSKISVTSYLGNDRTSLVRNDSLITEDTYYLNRDLSEVRWSNNLLSIQYNKVLSKSTINLQAGLLNYKYFSRGYYELESSFEGNELSRTVDIKSNSNLQDYQISGNFAHYFNDDIKLQLGGVGIIHQFQPTVRQSLSKSKDLVTEFEDPDTNTTTREVGLYSELNIKYNKFLSLHPGIRFSSYNTEGRTHLNVLPRARIQIHPTPMSVISLSFSRMAQNVHQLSNPGLGIASDLWVPSTAAIEPTILTQTGLIYKQTLSEGIHLSASWYNKRYENLIEYALPIDFHANIISRQPDIVFFTNETDWEEHVEIGTGISNGFSVSMRKEVGKLQGRVSYHYSTSRREFEKINDGNSFSAKFDRPNDINLGMVYKYSKRFLFGLNWVYSSGSTFSLPNEEFNSDLEITLIRPNGRNNFRLPSFHQLTFTGEYDIKMGKTDAHINFGIYNVYNRLNPFYLYATNDPNRITPSIKKVSIFPILPFFNITWKW